MPGKSEFIDYPQRPVEHEISYERHRVAHMYELAEATGFSAAEIKYVLFGNFQRADPDVFQAIKQCLKTEEHGSLNLYFAPRGLERNKVDTDSSDSVLVERSVVTVDEIASKTSLREREADVDLPMTPQRIDLSVGNMPREGLKYVEEYFGILSDHIRYYYGP